MKKYIHYDASDIYAIYYKKNNTTYYNLNHCSKCNKCRIYVFMPDDSKKERSEGYSIPLPIKEQTNQKREIETMTNNILKFSTPYNLRQTKFFESYKLFDSIVDLSDSYINEIKSAFKEFIRGETKTETINNLLIRACLACYYRGAADEKTGRVIPLHGQARYK